MPVAALGLVAGRETFGHRFHTTGPLSIRDADSYARQLEDEGKVLASFARRRDRIEALVKAAADRIGATAVMPGELLDEVTALVEWPAVYESGFEREFLDVPQECLILTMQQNQKYFALKDTSGRLLSRFLLVSHLDAADPRQSSPAMRGWCVRGWPMPSSSSTRTASARWSRGCRCCRA